MGKQGASSPPTLIMHNRRAGNMNISMVLVREDRKGRQQPTTKQDEVIRVFQVWKAARTMIANKTSVKTTLSLSRTPENNWPR